MRVCRLENLKASLELNSKHFPLLCVTISLTLYAQLHSIIMFGCLRTTSAISPSSKAKLVYFNIKTFIEMFMFSYFPEIKFLSVICVHFPLPSPSTHLISSNAPAHVFQSDFLADHKFQCFSVVRFIRLNF